MFARRFRVKQLVISQRGNATRPIPARNTRGQKTHPKPSRPRLLPASSQVCISDPNTDPRWRPCSIQNLIEHGPKHVYIYTKYVYNIYIHAYIYVYAYIYMYSCTYMYICIYIYILLPTHGCRDHSRSEDATTRKVTQVILHGVASPDHCGHSRQGCTPRLSTPAQPQPRRGCIHGQYLRLIASSSSLLLSA